MDRGAPSDRRRNWLRWPMALRSVKTALFGSRYVISRDDELLLSETRQKGVWAHCGWLSDCGPWKLVRRMCFRAALRGRDEGAVPGCAGCRAVQVHCRCTCDEHRIISVMRLTSLFLWRSIHLKCGDIFYRTFLRSLMLSKSDEIFHLTLLRWEMPEFRSSVW